MFRALSQLIFIEIILDLLSVYNDPPIIQTTEDDDDEDDWKDLFQPLLLRQTSEIDEFTSGKILLWWYSLLVNSVLPKLCFLSFEASQYAVNPKSLERAQNNRKQTDEVIQPTLSSVLVRPSLYMALLSNSRWFVTGLFTQ